MRILGASNPAYLDAMQRYMDSMEAEVLGKVDRLKELGWEYVVKK